MKDYKNDIEKIYKYNYKFRIIKDRIEYFLIAVLVILCAVFLLKNNEKGNGLFDYFHFLYSGTEHIIILIVGIVAFVIALFTFFLKIDVSKYEEMKKVVREGNIIYENAYYWIVDSVLIDKNNFLNMFYVDEAYKMKIIRNIKAINNEKYSLRIYTKNSNYTMKIEKLSVDEIGEFVNILKSIFSSIEKNNKDKDTLDVNHKIPDIKADVLYGNDFYSDVNPSDIKMKFAISGIVGLISFLSVWIFGLGIISGNYKSYSTDYNLALVTIVICVLIVRFCILKMLKYWKIGKEHEIF